MTFNPLALIEKLINEHGSSAILRERLLLVKDELTKLQNERSELLIKVSNLEKEKAELIEQLQQKSIPSEYKEYMGALFKKDSTGKFLPIAHCPECKRPLWNTEPGIFPYECSTKGCGYLIMINEPLTAIADKLNKN